MTRTPDPAFSIRAWRQRYYQAIALQKLGRNAEAGAFLDAMEFLAANQELSANGRRSMLQFAERARFAPDDAKDPLGPMVEVAARAEL